MDMDTLKPMLALIVRHSLTTFGGVLVSSGYMQSNDMSAFIGGGMVVAGVAWSWWQKEGQRRVVAILAKMNPVAPQNATTSEAVKAALDVVAKS